MASATKITRSTGVGVPDTPAGLFGSFPTGEVVGIAAASLPAVSDPAHLRDRLDWITHAGLGRAGVAGRTWTGLGIGEGPQLLIQVSPGTIRFARSDYARKERSAQGIGATARNRDSHDAETARIVSADTQVALSAAYRDEHGEPERKGRARITSWSRKSRANMAYTLNALDYSPVLEHGGCPAMVTLTYPGDWLPVAGSAEVCQGHLRALRKRFQRAWGRPMVGVWKREFQRRGAPHFHILMVPPVGRRNGQTFPEWLSSTWAAVVDHPDPVQRMLHEAAGTNVDTREGSRYTDPRRVGAYFSKHGLFSAKDYQNEAPSEWDPEDGIGRFWGVWGLSKAVVTREVEPAAYDALRRTTRRYQAATQLRDGAGRPATVKVPVWRKVTTVDKQTGEVGWKWRRRMVTKRMRPRLSGRAGFLAVNDGPGFVMAISRQVTGEGRSSFAEWSRGH